MSASNEEKEFIAGFIDGDGCLRIPKPTKKLPNPGPVVYVMQSHDAGPPPELVYIQARYGGDMIEKPPVAGARKCWVLRFLRANESMALIRDIATFGALKSKQARRAVDYFDQGKNDAPKLFEELRLDKKNYSTIDIEPSKITEAYIAGLFAAEGSLGMNKASDGGYVLQTTITQYGCGRLLEAIRDKIGFGSICSGPSLRFSTAQSLTFFKTISPFLIGQKARQVQLVEEYHRSRTSKRGKKRTAEETKEMETIAKKLKEMKKE